eukprot:scaffold49795_cov60-Phaeocystis_antarctica.AAC.2
MTAGASPRYLSHSRGAAGGGAAGSCPPGCIPPRPPPPHGGSSSRRTRGSAYRTAGRSPRRALSSPPAAASARSRSGRGPVAIANVIVRGEVDTRDAHAAALLATLDHEGADLGRPGRASRPRSAAPSGSVSRSGAGRWRGGRGRAVRACLPARAPP